MTYWLKKQIFSLSVLLSLIFITRWISIILCINLLIILIQLFFSLKSIFSLNRLDFITFWNIADISWSLILNRIFFLFFFFFNSILALGLILKSSWFNLRITSILLYLSSHFNFLMSSFSCKLSSLDFLFKLQFSGLSRSISFLLDCLSHLRNQWYWNIIFFIFLQFLLFFFLPVSNLRLLFHVLLFLFFTVWAATTFIIVWIIFLSSLIGHSIPVFCSRIWNLSYLYLLYFFFFFFF